MSSASEEKYPLILGTDDDIIAKWFAGDGAITSKNSGLGCGYNVLAFLNIINRQEAQ